MEKYKEKQCKWKSLVLSRIYGSSFTIKFIIKLAFGEPLLKERETCTLPNSLL